MKMYEQKHVIRGVSGAQQWAKSQALHKRVIHWVNGAQQWAKIQASVTNST